MRKLLGRRERHKRRKIGCLLLALILVATVSLVKLDDELRPIIQNYGTQAARRNAMLAIHDGVGNVLSKNEIDYGDFITIQRGEEDNVVSAETNIAAINLLKSNAVTEVTNRLSAQETQTVSVPMGNLIGGSFFTGRGPFLQIPIHTSGSVLATLSDSFTDAGINQTCHTIYLNMKVLITVLLPLERRSVELETQFLLCETIIVGDVPESYTHMDLGGNELFEKIFGMSD